MRRGRFLTAAAVAAGLLAIAPGASPGRPPAPRVSIDPTPLRLLEPRVGDVVSDGERFVVVTLPLSTRRPADVYDTFTGERTSLPAGCRLAGSADQTTTVTAGRALLFCVEPSRYTVLDLATGAIAAELPTTIEIGGTTFLDPRYETLGRRWVRASVDCPGFTGCANVYYDLSTGVVRREDPPDPRFYDLDAPDLPARPLCRSSVVYDEQLRHHRPPYYVDEVGLRLCSDGRLLQRFQADGDVISDLTAVGLTWGTTTAGWDGRPSPYVNLYKPAGRRLLRWRLPLLSGRRAFGTAVATRCELFALTSRSFDDRGGSAYSFRLHRARLPAPRDARCRR